VSSEARVARRRLRAYAALVVAVGGIAWSAILVRWAGVPGPASAFYRVLTAAAVLVPWRLADRRHDWPPWSAAVPAVLGGVFFAFDLALWNTAVMHTQAAIASVLGNNTPIFVGLMSWVIFRRRPPGAFWAGLALALAGCTLIAWADIARTSTRGTLHGDALALIACVFFAAYLATTERVRTRMDTLTFSTLAILGSVATLWLVCLALRVPLAHYDGKTWVALVALGLVSQLAAYFALVYALGHLSATTTSVGLLAQVPCTALLAVVLLGEPLSPLQIAGAGVVLAGIYVVTREPWAAG
jgi:drug/metabolite transporter (DMT)-like permease